MFTKEQLLCDLEKLGIDKEGTLLIHSSMKSIGQVSGGADTVIDSFVEYMKDGLLVLPTHTWSYVNKDNPVFSVKDSKSCIGILPEIFRHREGVYRSLHPTHSVAAKGKDAKEFVTGDHLVTTPCARESAWGRLLDRGATIMLLGVDLRRNTFIHGVEEWMNVEGRMTLDQEQLYVITEEGEKLLVPQHRHHGEHWSEYYWKVEDVFLEYGAMHLGTFGEATVRICDTIKMTKILEKMIAINPDLFSNNLPLERDRYVITLE